jgi:hypothetical protein
MMFDFQKELESAEITAEIIDLYARFKDEFGDEFEVSFHETIFLGDLFRMTNDPYCPGLENVEITDQLFISHALAEIKQYLATSQSITEFIQRSKQLQKEKTWFTAVYKAIRVTDWQTPEFHQDEMSLIPKRFLIEARFLNEQESMHFLEKRTPRILERMQEGVNQHISKAIEELLCSKFTQNLEEQLLNAPIQPKERSKSQIAATLVLSGINPVNEQEFLRDIFDSLKKNQYLLGQSKHQFNSLFQADSSNPHILDWSGSISSLALFAKALPLENENRLQVIAARFTCKGKAVTNSQLNNNGRIPSTQQESDLVTFLEHLIATYS